MTNGYSKLPYLLKPFGIKRELRMGCKFQQARYYRSRKIIVDARSEAISHRFTGLYGRPGMGSAAT